MEIWVAIVGLFVAAWQLHLQKRKLKKPLSSIHAHEMLYRIL